jgi:hypothetical protein
VRVPAAMNRFLDRHGVLDADNEVAARSNPRFATLLPADRTPTPLASEALVIINSSQPLPVAAAIAALQRQRDSLSFRKFIDLNQPAEISGKPGCS